MTESEKLAATQSIHLFLESYGITNDQGEKLDFKDHAYLWDIYKDFSPKQAILKAAQIGFCLSPDTKILTTDYKWVAIDDIKIGDSLISVDELHNGKKQGRKKRIAIIERKNEVYEEAIKLTLQDGTVLIATLNHRFLSKKRGAVDTTWREVKNFKINDTIRYFCDVWEDGDFEDGWMGGLLDGEGSLRRKGGSELTIVQTEGYVLDRAKKYFSDRGYSHRALLRTTKRGLGKKPIWEITTSNTAEIYKIIGQTKPSRFINRTDWWEGACIGRDKNKEAWGKVVSIESLGKTRMIDIQTSTKTFIANGYVSHNSTAANIKALWLAKNKKLDIIYSLPSASDIKDFVGGKTNRLIANNPVFQEWTADKDSIEQKRVGSNVIYFRGTWTERAAIAIPADLYISDETDRSKQEIVSQYATRLQHSSYAWEWYFSNPSVPGNGVDKYWQISDQKHWFVRCDCGKGEHNGRQFLTMENIKYSKIGMPYFGCNYCGKELNRRAGEWIRKYQDKPYSGYWISLMMNPRITAEYVLTKKKEFSEEQFANFVLGQPYVGKGNVITKNIFFQNLVSQINPQDSRPIIGVDTGKGINYVVGNKYGLFFYDKCEDYGPLENL
ncbi:MAG: phage terminase large subunit family protein [Candidatus Omnitrophota bacterium]